MSIWVGCDVYQTILIATVLEVVVVFTVAVALFAQCFK